MSSRCGPTAGPGPRAVAAAVLVLSAHGLALLSPGRAWGLAQLAYLPPLAVAAFGLLSLILLLPAVQRQLLWGAASACAWRRRLPGAARAGLLPGLALLAFAAFPTATHLLGDGYLYLGELEAAGRDWARLDRAPLAFALIRTVVRAGAALGLPAELAFRSYSWLAGVAYAFLVPVAARCLTAGPAGAFLLGGLLLTQGFVVLLCGYVETYAVVLPVLLLYLVVAARALEGRLPVWVPVGVFGVLAACHLLALSCAPSLAYLAWARAGDGRGRRAANLAVAGLGTPLLLAALVWLCGGGVTDLIGAFKPRSALPLLSPAIPEEVAYGLLSADHASDLANLALLVAPVPVALLFLLPPWRTGRRPLLRLLEAAWVPALLATFLANPDIGAFRDWDALSLAYLPLAVWAALAADRALAQRGPSTAPVLLVGAAGLHLASWWAVNASAPASAQRFRDLLAAAPLSHYARGYGWGSLASYERDRGRHQESLAAYEEALRASPHTARFAVGAGFACISLERYAQARDRFRLALAEDASRAASWSGLGLAHLGLGESASALAALQRAVELAPHDSEILANLCQAHNLRGDYASALDACSRALARNPEEPWARFQLAGTYLQLGRREEARQQLPWLRRSAPELAARLEGLL